MLKQGLWCNGKHNSGRGGGVCSTQARPAMKKYKIYKVIPLEWEIKDGAAWAYDNLGGQYAITTRETDFLIQHNEDINYDYSTWETLGTTVKFESAPKIVEKHYKENIDKYVDLFLEKVEFNES